MGGQKQRGPATRPGASWDWCTSVPGLSRSAGHIVVWPRLASLAELNEMASRFTQRRQRLLALAAIILLALVLLLLVVGLRGGLFRLGQSASPQGSTGGGGSSLAG